jgi:purine-binding chemotaxis protein CheW
MVEPFVIFKVAASSYAVRSATVQQIEMVENITSVPNALPFVEGVTYLRGKVVPVINLRQRFGMDKIPYDTHSRLIVIHLENRIVAMAADEAREFLELDETQIMPPPESLTGAGTEYLEGVIALDQRLILVVNLSELLSTQEKNALAAADPGPGGDNGKE